MTSSDEDAATEEHNVDAERPVTPLRQPLTTEQVRLLQVIAWPVFAGLGEQIMAWPAWSWAARRFGTDTGADAAEVLGSLPQLPAVDGAESYGLVWRGRSPSSPSFQAVGLTVAGLLETAACSDEQPWAADVIATILTLAMQREAELPANDMWSDARATVRIDQFLRLDDKLRLWNDGHTHCLTPTLIGEVLLHEYRPLVEGAGVVGGYDFVLGEDRFRHLAGVTDAESYVDAVERAAAAATAGDALPRAAFPLPQTLDFLAYVLRADPDWTQAGGGHLTRAPDLTAAASLAGGATSAAEFQTLLGNLWSVIGNLAVPPATDSDLKRKGWEKGGSINSLAIWLEHRLGPEQYAARAGEAIRIIRQVGKVRQEGAHPSAAVRSTAAAARQQLGLTAIPTGDWRIQYQAILDTLANAFDVIRTEIQHL